MIACCSVLLSMWQVYIISWIHKIDFRITIQNLKIHFIVTILVVILGIVLKINFTEWAICFLLFGFVITAELMNTAIEVTVDLAMPDINEKAKLAKDIAAGAVLVSSIVAVLIGLAIFLPKIIELIF